VRLFILVCLDVDAIAVLAPDEGAALMRSVVPPHRGAATVPRCAAFRGSARWESRSPVARSMSNRRSPSDPASRPETAPAHNRAPWGDSETALLTLKSWRAKQRKGRLSPLDRSRESSLASWRARAFAKGEADHLGVRDWQQIALAEDA
jgi:hypothetical protein